MNPLKERRERLLLSAWHRRMTLVFDERWSDTHRLTCLEPDLTDADRLCALGEVITAALQSDLRRLVVDLSRVCDADSKLIGMLLHAKRAASDRGVRLSIQMSEHIERWAAVCRVESLLTSHSHPPDPPRACSDARLAG